MTNAGEKPLDAETICPECVAVLERLELTDRFTADLTLTKGVRFSVLPPRVTIWKAGAVLWLDGQWTETPPRHLLVTNFSRRRGAFRVKLCVPGLRDALKIAK
jgi:hypothetical protein